MARACAADSVADDSSTTVHASLPAGQSAISGVPVPSSVAGGIVASGVGVATGVGVAAGCWATCSASPASSTSARTSASAAIASSAATSATGPRQLGGAAMVEVTSAPQLRHHSCCGVSSLPQRGQRRVCSCSGGGGASTAVTASRPVAS